MVEYNGLYLDSLFGALADPTRRDILQRLIRARSSIGKLAQQYEISFAAVAKHIGVLEKANLITKERRGKEQIVSIKPQTFAAVTHYLTQYEALWNSRFDALDNVLKEEF